MTWSERVVERAKREGVIWLGGEMEIPYPCLIQDAFRIAVNIAEQCGYVVTHYHGTRSMLSIVGGDIPGEVVLDWFEADREGPTKIELLRPEVAYLK